MPAGHDPRPRSRRHRHRGRRGGHDRRSRRSRARLVYQLVRPLPILQAGPLRPLHRWWRLDPRPHDQRRPGRVRPDPVRRHLALPGARAALRRAGALSRRHPADRLRGRCSERQRARPATPSSLSVPGPVGLAAMMTAKLYTPGTDHRDRPRRLATRTCTPVRGGRDDQQQQQRSGRAGHGADRRARRRRCDRGGRRLPDLRALHGAGAAGRQGRERRRARRARQPCIWRRSGSRA